MGADIHPNCHIKENGVWKSNNENIFPNPNHYYYKKQREEDLINGKRIRDLIKIPDYAINEFSNMPDGQRHYDWFGLLANVCNGNNIQYISEPRGFPSDYIYNEDKEYLGDHSHSWVRYIDFHTIDWEQKIVLTGVISFDKYIQLKNTNQTPNGWSKSISGPNIKIISMEEADVFIDTGLYDKSIHYYVEYKWFKVYKEWFNEYFDSWIIPLKQLTDKYGDARIIFGFDS